MSDNFYDEIEKALKDKETYNNKRYEADKEMLEKYVDVEKIMLEKYVDVEKIKLGNLEYIYFISTLINSCYSTRMGADRLFATAIWLSGNKNCIKIKDILTKEALDNNDLDFINGICNQKIEGVLGGVKFHSHSFITKFLKIHDKYGKTRKIFPIYDGNVVAVIKEYKLNEIDTLKEIVNSENAKSKEEAIKILEELEKEKTKTKTKTLDIKNYVLFYKIMSILTIVLGTNFHDLDQAFWKLGKDILDKQRKEREEKRREEKRREEKRREEKKRKKRKKE